MQANPNRAHLEDLPPSEWARLVRLCAHISGSADVAEDLAQETLIEAWRCADRLRDQDAHRAWLSGIARNVCLRWRRRLEREIDRLGRVEAMARLTSAHETASAPEIAIERDEMAALLDRALASLPDGTRDVLVRRYLDDLGNREIAERLSLSEGAVAVRLHRGRSALRAALSQPELRAEAEAFGLPAPEDSGWRQSRIWCPFCGRHRLKTRVEPDTGMLYVVCEGPCMDAGAIIGGNMMHPDTRELTSIKSIVSRELVHLNDFYRSAMADGGNRCAACGHFLPLDSWHPERPSPTPTEQPHGIHMRCERCGYESSASLWHLMIDTPEAQRFWRRHPRMAALPVQEIERDGVAALVSGFAGSDGARIEIVSARETFDILHVDGPNSR